MDEIDKLILNLQGLKQKDVAKSAGISVATLSNLLNRKSDPKITTIQKINDSIVQLKSSQNIE